MERSAILAQAATRSTPDDLPPHVTAGLALGPAPSLGSPADPGRDRADPASCRRSSASGWNHSRAAEALGIGRTTLWRKLKEYGIDGRRLERRREASAAFQNGTRVSRPGTRPIGAPPSAPWPTHPRGSDDGRHPASWTTSPRAITARALAGHRGHPSGRPTASRPPSASSGADAFDVIVTDLRMPDGVGLDVLHAAKTHCPDANVILLTGVSGLGVGQGGDAARRVRLLREGAGARGALPEDRQCARGASRAPAHRTRLPRDASGGAAATAEGEHRYLTVLFADMRGSTELLAGRDLDEAREILDGVIERLMAAGATRPAAP